MTFLYLTIFRYKKVIMATSTELCLMTEIADLKERLDKLTSEYNIVLMERDMYKREVHQYSLKEMQNLRQKRELALKFHRDEYERTHPNWKATETNSVEGLENGQDEIG